MLIGDWRLATTIFIRTVFMKWIAERISLDKDMIRMVNQRIYGQARLNLWKSNRSISNFTVVKRRLWFHMTRWLRFEGIREIQLGWGLNKNCKINIWILKARGFGDVIGMFFNVWTKFGRKQVKQTGLVSGLVQRRFIRSVNGLITGKKIRERVNRCSESSAGKGKVGKKVKSKTLVSNRQMCVKCLDPFSRHPSSSF